MISGDAVPRHGGEARRQAAARAELECLRQLTGAIAAGLFAWSPETDTIEYRNREVHQIFGWEASHAPQTAAALAAFVRGDDAVCLRRALADAAASPGTRFNVTVSISTGSGSSRCIRIDGVSAAAASSTPFVLCSAQALLEPANSAAQTYLDKVIDALPVGIVVSDSAGRTLSMNRAALAVHGFASTAEMLSHFGEYKTAFELRYPDGSVMPVHEWPFSRARRNEQVKDYEVRLRARGSDQDRVVRYSIINVSPEHAAGSELYVFVVDDITDRHYAQQRLRQSEAQYRALFDSIDEGFCVIKLVFDSEQRPVDYLYLEANAAFERHTGLANPVGKTILDMVPDVSRTWCEIYGKVAVTRQPIRMQMEEPAMDRFFDLYAFPVGAPEEHTVAVLFTDVTARTNAQTALESARRDADAQRRLLDAVLDSLPVGVIVGDPSGKLVRWNRANEVLWGLTGICPEQTGSIEQYRDWKGWWPETGQRIKPEEWALARALLHGEIVDGEVVEIERFDGTGRRFMVNMAAPVLDADGTIVAAVAAQTDVTDRVLMERALRESEARERARGAELEAIMDAVPAGIFTARSKNAERITGNRAAYDLLRLPAGANASVTASPGDRPTHFSALKDGRQLASDELPVQSVARTGEPVRNYEFDILFRDGDMRHLFGNVVPLFASDGRPSGSVGAFIDITERRRIEAALERSNESLRQFAYAASHDLQEPLRTVSAFTQLLSRQYGPQLDARANDHMNAVIDAANRMSTLVRDLLAYSRASATEQCRRERVDASECVRTAVENLHARITESGAEISWNRLPVVFADPARLPQLFQNLIGNAIKYRNPAEPPRITISGEERGGYHLFAVRDNGLGFKAQHADRIFGVFKRLHGREIPGTGIGLAICKTIVEQQGGRIWAEAEEGAGATFYFTLPAGT